MMNNEKRAARLEQLYYLFENAEIGCNHIVGQDCADDDLPLVYASDLKFKTKRIYYSRDMERFAFCPICGERVHDECDFSERGQ